MKKTMFAMMALVAMVVFMGCQPSVTPKEDPTYTVTYNLNGYTGTAPVDSKAYLNGETVTVAANLADIDANNTFVGWSLSTTGTTTTSFAISSNTTLYAQWKKVDASITFTKVADYNVSTKVYQKNGVGTYYTVDGDVVVANDMIYTVGYGFVNDNYRMKIKSDATPVSPSTPYAMVTVDSKVWMYWIVESATTNELCIKRYDATTYEVMAFDPIIFTGTFTL